MKAENSKKRRFLCILFITAWMMLGAAVTVSAAASGSWSVSKSSYSFLTSGQKKIFNKALNGLAGVTYKPVALLAKQTLANTNYAFLAQGTTVTQKPVTNWYLLTVCKKSKNKAVLLSVKKIKVSSVKTNKNPRAAVLDGGWEIVAVKNKTAALPKKARSAYQKALKTFTGYSLRPIALLGTQVVAGTNYRILCYGKERSNSDLFVVTIYQDLSGKCSLSSCKPLKLESYIKVSNP